MLVSLEVYLGDMLQKRADSASTTNGATGVSLRSSRYVSQGIGNRAQFPLRRALIIVSLLAEKHSLTIWLPIKQNVRKCFLLLSAEADLPSLQYSKN